MPDLIGPSTWPTPRGPWPEVTDDDFDRIFDHGAPWCVNAAGHPTDHSPYPNRDSHFPPFECTTRSLYVDAFDGLTGPGRELEIYAGRAYRFGELRTAARPDHTHVVFELYDETNDLAPRFSITLGDALRIAMHLLDIVRSVDSVQRD